MKRSSSARVITGWAAPLLTRLVQTRPAILTEKSLAPLLEETATQGTPAEIIRRLVRQGWLQGVGVRGAWAFLPPGVDELADPYLALRGWRAVDAQATFCLAGATAAWHLGYLPRRPDNVTIWLSEKTTLPMGLRGTLRFVKTRFPAGTDARRLAPSPALLKKRRLDITAWASHLPAFGPEALVVEMAQRPSSLEGWVDLAGKLTELANDVSVERLRELLAASSSAAHQRAAYFLYMGRRDDWQTLLPPKIQAVELGDDGPAHWHGPTGVNDHLLAPFRDAHAKG